MKWFLFVVCFVAGCCSATAWGAPSAVGAAQHTLTVEREIAGIVTQVAAGGAVRLLNGSGTEIDPEQVLKIAGQLQAELWVDGEAAHGPAAWKAAVRRVRGYVRDTEAAGSVEYRYQLTIAELAVVRRTRITDGNLVLTTDVGLVEWVPIELPRRTKWVPMPLQVRLVLSAHEQGGVTVITGRATAVADLRGFHCALVRRLAARRAPAEISQGLRVQLLTTIEQQGRKLYAEGDVEALVTEFVGRLAKDGVLQR